MTILSKLTTQELSALLACIVALTAYLFGYNRGRVSQYQWERLRLDDATHDLISAKDNEINWLRSLIDGDVDGDEDE